MKWPNSLKDINEPKLTEEASNLNNTIFLSECVIKNLSQRKFHAHMLHQGILPKFKEEKIILYKFLQKIEEGFSS